MDIKVMIPFEVIERMRKVAERLYEKGDINDAYLLASAIDDVVCTTGKPDFYAVAPEGVCPFCGDYDELICVGRKQYAVCHEHHVYWYIGTNYLLSEDDADEFLRQNRNLLRLYTQVSIKAAFPKDVCSCCGLFMKHASWCITPSTKPGNCL